jgi:hypothetical protein
VWEFAVTPVGAVQAPTCLCVCVVVQLDTAKIPLVGGLLENMLESDVPDTIPFVDPDGTADLGGVGDEAESTGVRYSPKTSPVRTPRMYVVTTGRVPVESLLK